MENYYEQSLTRQKTLVCSAVYALCWILIAVLLLLAVFFATGALGSDSRFFEIHWGNAIGLLLCLIAAGVLFVCKDHLRTEYDYILNDDVLEIHAVLNRRRRKTIARLDVKRIHSAGCFSPSCRDSMPDVKIHDCRVEQGGYYLYYQEANVRHMMLLNLDNQLAAQIRRRVGTGVWQNIEGK